MKNQELENLFQGVAKREDQVTEAEVGNWVQKRERIQELRQEEKMLLINKLYHEK